MKCIQKRIEELQSKIQEKEDEMKRCEEEKALKCLSLERKVREIEIESYFL